MADLFEMISKMTAYARGFLLKRKLHTLGPIKSFGKTIVRNSNGVIIIGKRSCLWPNVVFDLASKHKDNQAVIRVGSFTSIGDRTEIHCAGKVTIGDEVLIAWDVNIIENDYHTAGGGNAPENHITIEDEVWIGAHAIILKGVKIGKGAIIGAGAVVTKSVPAFSLAAGNPARIIKQVQSWTGSSQSDTEKH